MSDIITTLHPENNSSDNLYPNIKKENIPLGYSILQNYSVLNYLLSIEDTLSSYDTACVTLINKKINYNGYANIRFRVKQEGVVSILICIKNDNEQFIVKNRIDVNCVTGWNNFKTYVNVNDYISIYFNTGLGYYTVTNTNTINTLYAGYSPTPEINSVLPNLTNTSTILFAYDFEIDTGEGGISGKNIDDYSIGKNKLSKNLMNELLINKSNISSILRASNNLKINLVGDSITYGLGSTDRNTKSWAGLLKNYLESIYNCIIINSGAAGISSMVVTQNLSNYIHDDDDIVLCMLGTNNRNNETFYNSLYNDYTIIKNYCLDRNIKFIPLVSIPASITDEETRYKHMDDINHIMESWCLDNKYELINLYEEFYKYCGYDNDVLNSLLDDGLHPNDNGYYIIFRIICEHLGVKAKIKNASW
ncbi:MAG: SGNH/GDSL hydrolase family protein [Bacillales bacterium]|nr:SGNH/GDSL hydrolase family protein [Bacillales bacterium]